MTIDEAFQLVAIAVDGISARALQRLEADMIAAGVEDAEIDRLLEQSLETMQAERERQLLKMRAEVEAWLRRDCAELQ